MKTNILQAKKALLALFAMLMPLLASAHDFAVDGIYYKIISNKTVYVSYRGDNENSFKDEYQGIVEIPTTVKYNNTTYDVVAIDENTFYGCKSLTSITISESITEIKNNAFRKCASLSTVNIAPNSKLTRIEQSAFGDCSVLSSISIPDGVTYIGYAAFDNCRQLKSIKISENSQLTTIDRCAFQSCHSLTSFDIPEGVTNISYSAFCDCSGLFSINIPKNVIAIEEMAFAYCYYLVDVFCYSDTIPSTHSQAFKNISLTNVTLHVPAKLIDKYNESSPWNNFGAIEAIKVPVLEITLSQSSATLTEGESITLTATVTPEDADDTSVTWSSSDEDVAIVSSKGKVVAMGLGTAIITATANDGSGVSASCEIIVKAPLLGKCATPTINYIDGEFVLTCSTEGAEIKTIVVTENDNEFVGEKFDFLPTHTFTAYATKENYEDSDVATLTICWIPCSEAHESEETSILTIPSKPVLISARDGVLTLSGLAEGTEVTLYTTDGVMVAHQQSCAGEAKFTVDTNQVYLVHIGDKVVKIGM